MKCKCYSLLLSNSVVVALHIVLFLFQISYVTFLFRVLIVSGGVVLHWTPNLEVRSGFEPWSGSFCCVLGQETLLSQCLSPSRLGEWGGQSTCDKNIILPIMTLLLTNDLPLFQPLVFLCNFFPFSKGKDTIICKTTKSWIIWIYFRCETKCCGIEVCLWSYIVPFFDKGMFSSFF